jgi:hypothetical protein
VRPALEVADIFRRYGPAWRASQGHRLSREQRRVMAAIEACRTAALGGCVDKCEDCGLIRVAYRSCRNRHCPKCQGLARAQWLADRQAELLPVPYFHLVFTMPAPAAAMALQNKAALYDMLFKAAAETVRVIAADPKHLGGETGMIAILHTWGQTLHHHPHLHCVIPGGAIAPDGRWLACRPNFFLPVHVLSRLYRRLFIERLQAAYDAGELKFSGNLAPLAEPAAFAARVEALRKADWVTFCKPPFAGPEKVLAYLGRYTHRVAIANSRLISCEDGKVTFQWKDYRENSKSKVMTLDAGEFMRRFLLHVLPKGFRKIRHFGFLANASRATKLPRIRAVLKVPPPPAPKAPAGYRERYELLTGRSLDVCPRCQGRMVEAGAQPRSPVRPAASARCPDTPVWPDTS